MSDNERTATVFKKICQVEGMSESATFFLFAFVKEGVTL